MITKPDGGEGNGDSKNENEIMRINASEHLRGIRHPAQIRSDVDGVGNEQRARDNRDDRARKFVMKRAGQTATGHHSDSGAHELHCGHQRPGDQRRPKQRRAERRASARISGDAGRIVIGRTGDNTGPEFGKETPQQDQRLLHARHKTVFDPLIF
jgi:hypothetical protein